MLRLPPHETSFPTSIAEAVALRVCAGAPARTWPGAPTSIPT